TRGARLVSAPSALRRCCFRGAYDVLHLHVPNRTIEEICRVFSDRAPAPFRPQRALARDPTVERLARALLASEQIGGSYGALYAPSARVAIGAPPPHLPARETAQPTRRS